MAIPEVSRETRSIEGHCDVARVAFAATSPTSSSTRLPKREHARSGATRSPRKRSSVRFAPDASDFFRTSPYAHFGRVRRVWARSGVFRAREARRARAIARARRGRSFSLSIFFSLVFFSRLVNTRSRRNLDRGRDARSRGHPRARIGRRRVRDATEHSSSRGSRRARARVAVEAAAAPPDRRVTRPRIPRTSLSREALQVFFLRLVFVFFTHKKPPPRSARSRLEKAHEGDEVDGVGG